MKIDDQTKAQRGDDGREKSAASEKSKDGKRFDDVLKGRGTKKRSGRRGRGREATSVPRELRHGEAAGRARGRESARVSEKSRVFRGRLRDVEAGRRHLIERRDDRCLVRRREEHCESGRLERRCHGQSVQENRHIDRRHSLRSRHRKAPWARGDAPTRPSSKSPGRRRGADAEPVQGPPGIREGVSPSPPARVETSQAAASSRGAENLETIRRLAGEVAKSLKVGVDAAKRQVVLMDVEIPGRGTVHIRLRRQGAKFDARFRADDHGLARMLRRHREDLRQAGDDAGVQFGELRVADPN